MRIDVESDGSVILSSVFLGIGIATEEGYYGIAQRDTGLEIQTPDGQLVGVKLDTDGELFLELNCKSLELSPESDIQLTSVHFVDPKKLVDPNCRATPVPPPPPPPTPSKRMAMMETQEVLPILDPADLVAPRPAPQVNSVEYAEPQSHLDLAELPQATATRPDSLRAAVHHVACPTCGGRRDMLAEQSYLDGRFYPCAECEREGWYTVRVEGFWRWILKALGVLKEKRDR